MLRGKSALVTGSTQGIWLAIATWLAAEGHVMMFCAAVSNATARVCGPDGADTTGAAISIDGGWSVA
jgi:NAD(P)-dependent dehydrogenase (short-subunit alcohol dehydrogenase family)